MLVGSLVLASVAGTSSVAAAFPQLEALVDDLASRVQGLVGVAAPAARGTNGEFPEHRPIRSSWTPGRARPRSSPSRSLGDRHYWRSASWDTFDGRAWDRTETTTQDIPAGEDLLESSEDAVSTGSTDHRGVTATITSVTLAGQPAAGAPEPGAARPRRPGVAHG